jgi:Spy/CpxP family protein refolding chaperone
MRNRTAKLLVIALLSSATVAMAQRPERPGRGGPRGNRIDFLATVLSLSDEQKTQATAIFETAQQASTSLRDSLAQQRQALNDAAKSNAADVQIDQLASNLGTTMGQLQAIQTKAFGKFYALLTTEQRTKLDQLHANGHGEPFGFAFP